jgi:frataxin-like iron-binding protein CyaY
MPFRHVVMFKWADHAPDDQADRVREGLNALPPIIDQIRGYVHGTDVGVAEGNFDYVLVADFDNVADFVVYRDHPQHQLFIAEVITGNVAGRAAVQYQTGPS